MKSNVRTINPMKPTGKYCSCRLDSARTTHRILCLLMIVLAQTAVPLSPTQASFDQKKGARPIGMGGAFTAVANTGDALYYNPAGLWVINSFHTQMFYSAPFNMPDLSTVACNLTYPTAYGNGTFNVETYGFDLYRETSVGIAYSQAYRKKLLFGLVLNYNHLAIKRGGHAGTFGADIGLLYKPHDHLAVGMMAKNINRPELGGDPLPQVFCAGAAYTGLSPLTVSMDLYKDVRYPADLRLGVEYVFLKRLYVRTGFSTKPSHFTGGFGFDFGMGVIDYAFYTTGDLGVTHAVSTSIYLNRQPSRTIKSGIQ